MFLEQAKTPSRTPPGSHTLPLTSAGLPRLQISPKARLFDGKPINQMGSLPPAGGSHCWRPCAGNMANVASFVDFSNLQTTAPPHDCTLERDGDSEALANQRVKKVSSGQEGPG